jgi:hypothetical protein
VAEILLPGLDDDGADLACLLAWHALRFCAAPETFPVFIAYAKADEANSGEIGTWAQNLLAALEPSILTALAVMMAQGRVDQLTRPGRG